MPQSLFAKRFSIMMMIDMCPRSSYPFYIVTYFIKWVTSSWTDSRLYGVSKIHVHNLDRLTAPLF